MNKLAGIILGIFALYIGGQYIYDNYLVIDDSVEIPPTEEVNDVEVTCLGEYDFNNNDYEIDCTVVDVDNLVSIDNPVVVSLLSNSNELSSLLIDIPGDVHHTFSNLPYDTIIELEIYYNGDEFIEYYSSSFNTVEESIILPTVNIAAIEVTDTSLNIGLSYNDIENRLVSSELLLIESDGTIIERVPFSNFGETNIVFEDLSQLVEYDVQVILTYSCNSTGDVLTVEQSSLFTTEMTLYHSFLEVEYLEIVDNILTLNITLTSNDAMLENYTVIIQDSSEEYYSEPMSNVMNFDITDIIGAFEILILGEYYLDDELFQDIVMFDYTLERSYSNFFDLGNLQYVDTTAEINTYDDFIYYLFTYVDQGIYEFDVTCNHMIDCSVFAVDDQYITQIWSMNSILHSYNSFNSMSYYYNTQEISFEIDKTYSDNDILLINDEVKLILNTIITDTMTDYEKILAVHDYVVNTTVYDVQCGDDFSTCDTDGSAIGVLFDSNAVCEGYAHAVDIMLRALNIPTVKVISETHMWNAVYIGNEWLHLDATWDDPVTNDGSNVLTHDFFLIDTATLHLLDSSTAHDYNEIEYDFIQ